MPSDNVIKKEMRTKIPSHIANGILNSILLNYYFSCHICMNRTVIGVVPWRVKHIDECMSGA